MSEVVGESVARIDIIFQQGMHGELCRPYFCQFFFPCRVSVGYG